MGDKEGNGEGGNKCDGNNDNIGVGGSNNVAGDEVELASNKEGDGKSGKSDDDGKEEGIGDGGKSNGDGQMRARAARAKATATRVLVEGWGRR